MKIEIQFSKAAIKFIFKNSTTITKHETKSYIISALQKLLLGQEVNIDLKKLKGKWKDYYRIRKGNIRIIFSIQNKQIIIVSVHSIDMRKNIY